MQTHEVEIKQALDRNAAEELAKIIIGVYEIGSPVTVKVYSPQSEYIFII